MISLYLHSGKWYDKKKPVLQLKILDNLSSNKQLSKSQARKMLEGSHHWPEISNAFDNLKTRGFIEAIARDTSKQGNPEIFYRLTADGIAVLIVENPSPKRFWYLLMHYCYSREENEKVTIQTINDFYDFFSKRIFRFSSGHNSLIMLDTLNDVCNDWLNRFSLLSPSKINESDFVDNTTLRDGQYHLKVLEILINNPDLTIYDLSLRLGVTPEPLEEAISSMSMPSDGNFVTRKISLDKHYVTRFRHTFLEHCFIVSTNTTRGKNFRLSTLGIILFMTHVHRKYRNSSAFIKRLTKYYDAIALNYGALLPLIFGKWSILKKHLNYMAMDFGVILDKESRYRGKYSTSVKLGGVNEYYESMKNIVRQNSLTTKEIYNAAYYAFQEVLSRHWAEKRQNKLKSYKMKTNFNDTAKLESVLHKIYEISQIMRYQEAETNVRELFQGQYLVSPIEIYSKLVEDEVTFVYYINLIARYHGLDLPFLEESLENPIKLDTPHEILTKILEEDDEFYQWFTNWMRDIKQHLNEIFEIVINFEKSKHFVLKDERIYSGEADQDQLC